jgi:hypothetical protein
MCRELRVKAGVMFTSAIDEINSELTSLRAVDKLRSRHRISGDTQQLSDFLSQRMSVVWQQFFYTAGPRQVRMPHQDAHMKQACVSHKETLLLSTSGALYTVPITSHTARLVSVRMDAPGLKCVLTKIGCGDRHAAAISIQGFVLTWGEGRDGALGHGDYTDVASPTLVESLKATKLPAFDIVCGRKHTMSTRGDGSPLYCYDSVLSCTRLLLCAICSL